MWMCRPALLQKQTLCPMISLEQIPVMNRGAPLQMWASTAGSCRVHVCAHSLPAAAVPAAFQGVTNSILRALSKSVVEILWSVPMSTLILVLCVPFSIVFLPKCRLFILSLAHIVITSSTTAPGDYCGYLSLQEKPHHHRGYFC